MSKEGTNKQSKHYDEDIQLSVKTKKLSRLLISNLAEFDNISAGEVVLNALWEKTQRRIHPGTLKMIFERQDIDNQTLENCGIKFDKNAYKIDNAYKKDSVWKKEIRNE